jgi:hypothetical protein
MFGFIFAIFSFHIAQQENFVNTEVCGNCSCLNSLSSSMNRSLPTSIQSQPEIQKGGARLKIQTVQDGGLLISA